MLTVYLQSTCQKTDVVTGIFRVKVNTGSLPGGGHYARHLTQMSSSSVSDNLTKLEPFFFFNQPPLVGRNTCFRKLKNLGLHITSV